jgi:hypothetical protein
MTVLAAIAISPEKFLAIVGAAPSPAPVPVAEAAAQAAESSALIT